MRTGRHPAPQHASDRRERSADRAGRGGGLAAATPATTVAPPAVTVESVKAVDPLLEEIAALYASDFARFVRVAAAITGDSESARDVVQDAFANLVRHRAEHRADASLGGWAWRAVVNGATSELRARAYSARATARLTSLRQHDAGDDTQDTALRTLLRGLPERQRLIVFLRYYADLDYATIATALALSAGTIGATLNAARATLRTALRAEER